MSSSACALRAPQAPLTQQAKAWMEEHPEVLALFEQLAEQCAMRGRRFGIGHVTEVVRWEFQRLHPGRPGFRLCNSYRADIARELIRRRPWLAEFIELRALRRVA